MKMKKMNSEKQSTKRLRLTRAVISDMFDKCNALYFNNEIERPAKFETWTPLKRTLGMVTSFRTGKNRIGSILHISRRYRWNEEDLRHVVSHEMIHLEIGDYKEPLTYLQRLPIIGRFFIKQHDDRFIKRMNELNKHYGLNIGVQFPAMKKNFIK